jgi:hypothetical protein
MTVVTMIWLPIARKNLAVVKTKMSLSTIFAFGFISDIISNISAAREIVYVPVNFQTRQPLIASIICPA